MWFLDSLVVVHRSASGAGPFLLEFTLPVGGAPPLHRHDAYDDSEYLLDGQLVVDDAGTWSIANPGEWLSTRRGLPHRFASSVSDPHGCSASISGEFS